jgi:hypothetical protein
MTKHQIDKALFLSRVSRQQPRGSPARQTIPDLQAVGESQRLQLADVRLELMLLLTDEGAEIAGANTGTRAD